MLWQDSQTSPGSNVKQETKVFYESDGEQGSENFYTSSTAATSTAGLGSPSISDKYPYNAWDSRAADAKSRNSKPTETFEERDAIYTYLHYKPLNILTLGGSVAWGGYIPNRYDAFPFLLGDLHPDSRVDNLAIRATGATYPAACIQSMLEGDGAFPEYDVAPGGSSSHRSTIYYDIILLEFSINGVTSTDSLISRLKRRYPDAIIVYAHLESIAHPIDQELNHAFFKELMDPVNGIYYMLPKEGKYLKTMEKEEEDLRGTSRIEQGVNNFPEYFDLFADDKHHLSEVGHKFIADKIMNLLYTTMSQHPERMRPRSPRLGTWGGGDQCYLWLSSWGYFPESIDVVGGGKFTMFDVSKKKYSYEIEYGANTTFTFNRKNFGGLKIPVHLVYMTLVRMKVYAVFI